MGCTRPQTSPSAQRRRNSGDATAETQQRRRNSGDATAEAKQRRRNSGMTAESDQPAVLRARAGYHDRCLVDWCGSASAWPPREATEAAWLLLRSGCDSERPVFTTQRSRGHRCRPFTLAPGNNLQFPLRGLHISLINHRFIVEQSYCHKAPHGCQSSATVP